MKKTISILLAVLLLASLGTGAFAEADSVTYDEMGMTISYPDAFDDVKGIFEPYPQGKVADGLYYMSFIYIAFPYDDYEALLEKDDSEITEEDIQAFRDAQGVLAYVLAADGGRGPADIIKELELEDTTEENFTELAKVDDITFYQLEFPEETEAFVAGMKPEFAEEFSALHDGLAEALKNAEYSVPVVPGEELVGETLRFETTDFDGNPVKSEDIFAEHELTMINIWATWCGPCKGELKELGEMNRRLAEKDVAVIGICLDADEKLDDARALLEENNVDYLNLIPFEDIDEALNIPAYPTSYYVDREGRILGAPTVGAPADMALYENTIASLMKGENAPVTKSAPAHDSGADAYRVIVSDSDGDLVEGAMVQFCSDVSCLMGTTDENGVAEFDAEEGQTYTVHVLKVPEGYEKTSEGFETLDTFSDVYIVLQKAA